MPTLKTWFVTFTAVLLAGALLFAWHRSIVLWESQAEEISGSLLRWTKEAKEARPNRHEEKLAEVIYKSSMEVLAMRIKDAEKHLKAFVPLRDERDLQNALTRAQEEIQTGKEAERAAPAP